MVRSPKSATSLSFSKESPGAAIGGDRRPWSRTYSRSCPCRLSIVAPGVSVKRRISESGERQKKGDHPVDQAQTATSASRTAAWRSWIDSPAVRTLAVFLPAAAGFAIVQVNKGGDASFTTSGEFIIWSALIAVAVAIWVAMSLGLLQTVRELRGLFRDRGPALPVPGLFGVYGLYAAVLFAILTLGGRVQRLHSTMPPYAPEPSWPSGWRPPHPRS
jgi:hypothetical protein